MVRTRKARSCLVGVQTLTLALALALTLTLTLTLTLNPNPSPNLPKEAERRSSDGLGSKDPRRCRRWRMRSVLRIVAAW